MVEKACRENAVIVAVKGTEVVVRKNEVAINAPNILLNGNVQVNGSVTATGEIQSTAPAE